jgi:hypothetical protein
MPLLDPRASCIKLHTVRSEPSEVNSALAGFTSFSASTAPLDRLRQFRRRVGHGLDAIAECPIASIGGLPR